MSSTLGREGRRGKGGCAGRLPRGWVPETSLQVRAWCVLTGRWESPKRVSGRPARDRAWGRPHPGPVSQHSQPLVPVPLRAGPLECRVAAEAVWNAAWRRRPWTAGAAVAEEVEMACRPLRPDGKTRPVRSRVIDGNDYHRV